MMTRPKVARQGPGSLGDRVGTLEVNLVHQVPVGLFHLQKAHISQDAGVIDDNVDATKVINGRLDDGLTVLHRVVVGCCLATGLFDFLDHQISGLGTCALASVGGAEVIHDH